MKKSGLFILFVLFFVYVGQTSAGTPGHVKGQVVDGSDKPVAGAQVYVFDSENVKRPADFISNRTKPDGIYSLSLPAGKYWVVAILRQSGANFGPLGLGDKHSGEPTVLELAPDQTMEMDFTVLDLRDAAKKLAKKNEELIKISGRIVDSREAPVKDAYLIANRAPSFKEFPDALSPWTDQDGNFIMYLKRGKYFIAPAEEFPPPAGMKLDREITFNQDQSDFIIELSPAE